MIEAIIVLGLLGLAFGAALSVAAKVFQTETDPRIEQIVAALPGANCGACGKGGCMAFAEALVKGPVPDTAFCPPGGEETTCRIAGILGIEAKTCTIQKLTVLCNGGTRAKDKYKYAGIENCAAATAFYDGQKQCRYACLGFGDCVQVCPFGALEMGDDGLPVVIEGHCTNCGKCISSCPKELIVMRPLSSKVYVKCNSKDKGAVVARACKAGCIGCGKCVKACPTGAISLVDNLAIIDYNKCDNCAECVKACPTKVIIKQ